MIFSYQTNLRSNWRCIVRDAICAYRSQRYEKAVSHLMKFTQCQFFFFFFKVAEAADVAKLRSSQYASISVSGGASKYFFYNRQRFGLIRCVGSNYDDIAPPGSNQRLLCCVVLCVMIDYFILLPVCLRLASVSSSQYGDIIAPPPGG